MGRPRIGELLVEAKVISPAQLEEALREPRAAGQKIGQHLVEQGVVTEAQLTQTLSLQLSVPWVSLYHIDFSRQLLNMVPRELADRFCAVPILVRSSKKQGSTLYVAMDDPTNEAALGEIAQAAGMPVKPMIASPTDIRSAIRVYYAGEEADAPPAAPPAAPPPAPPTMRDRAGAVGVGTAGAPPTPPPARALPPPAPPTGRAPLPTVVDTFERFSAEAIAEAQAVSLSSSEVRAASPSEDSPDADPELEVSEYIPKRQPSNGPRMVALTLLDGTQLNLPARPSALPPRREGSIPPSAGGISAQLTAHDLVSALRAHAHGADATEILGATDWQAMFAALLSLMLKKNLIADWEFVEELRDI